MNAIVTVGLPACGKSTFAAAHADDYVELNLDALREHVSGDATNQDATGKAIWLRDRLLARYAAEGRNVLISDTHARARNRRRMIRRLRELGYHVQLVVFDVGEETCRTRNAARERQVPEEAIAHMARQLRENPPSHHEADAWTLLTQPHDRLFQLDSDPDSASNDADKHIALM